ncbi:MAG: beta strand repeat-containing protein [Lentimicrobium sp.]
MKNLNKNAVFFLLMGLLLATVLPLNSMSQIVSAPGGGNWTSPTTWIGETVPGSANDVIIESTVSVNSNSVACNNIQIASTGVLQNSSATNYQLTVYGNLTNNGIIRNNNNNGLNLVVIGNITNNSSWTNDNLTFGGSGNHEIASFQPMAVTTMYKNVSGGRVKATTGLSFIGTNISMNDTLEFTSGNSITMNGGYFSSGVLYKSALPALQITSSNGAYANGLTIDAPLTELSGILLIVGNSNVFKGHIVNYGTLQNNSPTNYSLTITGSLTNNGIIQDNVNDFYLNISGNLTNNGTWTNQSITLNGNANQDLSMTQPFGCANLTRNPGIGRVKATSGLSFNGTNITLYDTLEFTTGNSISMSGGSFSSGVMYKPSLPALQLTAGNGTFANGFTIHAVTAELNGSLLIVGNSNVFKGHIVNYGTLRNNSPTNYSLTVAGSVTNNGTITDNVNDFYLNISGNLTNNGTWTNYSTTLNGNGNQELSMTQPVGCSILTRNPGTGKVRAITDISFIGTSITLYDTLEFTTGNAISMNGGSLYSGVLYKLSLPAIKITGGNGNHINALVIDSPQAEFYGTIQIYGNSNLFKCDIINFGTIQNRSATNYTLNVTGSITNNGTIQNNINDFYLLLSGNVTNNGIWENRQTTLTGTNTHYLTFTNKFEGESFINNNAAASLISTTDVTFDGTTVDLNYCSFTLATGSRLSVMNGSLLETTISGTDIHFHSLGAFCQYVVLNSDVTLHGVFEVGTGVAFNGSIVNEGVLRNRRVISYAVVVQGGIVNNGSITNNVNSFTITVLGNISNNGIWSNLLTTLDGTTDQNITLINSHSITGEVRIDANFTGAGFVWYGPGGSLIGNPGFSGANTQLLRFLTPVTDAHAGQYYCMNNAAVHSRNIYINTQIIPVRTLQLTILLEGLYNGSGMMNPASDGDGNAIWDATIADQIAVDFRDNNNYENVVLSVPDVLLHTNGNATVTIPSVYNGSYYLAVKHRNSIETVSAIPVNFSGSTISFNFTNSAGQAYGDNQKDLNGDGSIWGFFSGDVTQDGYIEFVDVIPIYNRNVNSASGYLLEDIDGNGYVEFLDYIIAYNNNINSVGIISPIN